MMFQRFRENYQACNASYGHKSGVRGVIKQERVKGLALCRFAPSFSLDFCELASEVNVVKTAHAIVT